VHFVFEQIQTGGDRNFGYLIGDRDSGLAALVDPSYQPELLFQRAQSQQLTVKWIINTHGHHDHTNGNEEAKAMTKAPLAIFSGSPVAHDVGLNDGDELDLGNIKMRFLYTPGHCDDHMVIYIAKYGVALTGDHLFVGKVGVTHSEENARLEYASLKRVISELPKETTIWPGHDLGARPSSTISLELSSNPFLLCSNVDDFLDLKEKWPSFRRQKGLI